MRWMDDQILLIDKPKGITSFDVIRRLRRTLNIKKMGHAGTLDPLASGLMIIGVNRGTKKLNEYLKLPKVYEAQILLGKKTTTGDLEGETIESKEVSKIDLAEIKKVIKDLKGKIVLPVPLYSAIKLQGAPLYKYARKGQIVKPPEKEMKIIEIKLKNHFKKGTYHILDIEIKVASGTYIRSIAEEIGRRLNLPATVAQLRRTQIGKFKIEDAMQLVETTTLAGGCFWCTEAIFKRLRGVTSVISGYSGGITENPTYEDVCTGSTGHAEAVQIEFDPKVLPFEELLQVFFKLHNPTTLNQQGNDIGTQYRSAIFYHNDKQKEIALKVKDEFEKSGYYKDKIVTEIVPFDKFYEAEGYHKNYYGRNTDAPYCKFVIDPKIQKLYKDFKNKVKEN